MDRLSPLDVYFLHLERDVQQLHVGSALLFEGPVPTYGQLCAAIEAKLPMVPRYRQRVRRVPFDLGRPVWADDPRFDVRDHVRRTSMRSPGSDRQLRTLAARLMSEPLDLDRPLWEMWLVRSPGGGRWALVNKGHHAMIDGISGSDIMSVLLDSEPSPGRSTPRRTPPWRPAAEPSDTDLLVATVTDVLRSPLELGRTAAHALRRPRTVATQTATQAYGLLRTGAKVALPESVLDGPIGPQRRWGWARADLAEVKAVKNALGGTVNDVVLAAITGGLRTFLVSRGEDVEGRTVRTMVPVSTRAADDGAPGNQVSAVFADLPVGIADPADRLAAITRQLSGLKRSGMALGVDAMMDAYGFVPPTLFALASRVMARLPQRAISTVTTNVPGPQDPLYLMGRKMTEMFPYIPLALQLRVTIGIMSYDGKLSFGVTGDRAAVPDLDVLCAGIESATAELVALVT